MSSTCSVYSTTCVCDMEAALRMETRYLCEMCMQMQDKNCNTLILYIVTDTMRVKEVAKLKAPTCVG